MAAKLLAPGWYRAALYTLLGIAFSIAFLYGYPRRLRQRARRTTATACSRSRC